MVWYGAKVHTIQYKYVQRAHVGKVLEVVGLDVVSQVSHLLPLACRSHIIVVTQDKIARSDQE
jgi:hypothetical protein